VGVVAAHDIFLKKQLSTKYNETQISVKKPVIASDMAGTQVQSCKKL